MTKEFDNYTYKPSAQDSRIVDTENMSQEDWTDVATFTASVINSLHEAVGSEPLKVTKGSVQYAKTYSESYLAHQNEYTEDTNERVSSTVASKASGLNYTYPPFYDTASIDRRVESIETIFTNEGMTRNVTYEPLTLGEIKSSIYNYILAQLRDTYDSNSILGLFPVSGATSRGKYLNGNYLAVVVLDKYFSLVNIYDTVMSTNWGTTSYMSDAFDTTPYTIPSTKALQAKLTELKGQLPTLNANLKTATDNLTAKQTAKAAADKQVASLTADLKNNQDALAKLQAQKAVKDNGPEDLAAADQKVKDSTAKYNEAKQAYADAKSAYEAAQKQADTAKVAKDCS